LGKLSPKRHVNGLYNLIPWIKNVSFFADLDEKAIEDVAEISEIITFGSNENIFEENDAPDCLYIIISGQIAIEKIFPELKRRKTLAILEAGDFFGEMALITNNRRSASAVTKQESVLIKVEKAEFIEMLKVSSSLSFGMIGVVCKRLREADEEISTLSFQNIPGRVALKLIDLADQFGLETTDGMLINLDITHNDLSDMVGTNRETISKYISIFRKEGSIDSIDQKILIKNQSQLASWS
jgi:CRP/FNR family transcriptional regulator, cyclic AMP receptor protein